MKKDNGWENESKLNCTSSRVALRMSRDYKLIETCPLAITKQGDDDDDDTRKELLLHLSSRF